VRRIKWYHHFCRFAITSRKMRPPHEDEFDRMLAAFDAWCKARAAVGGPVPIEIPPPSPPWLVEMTPGGTA